MADEGSAASRWKPGFRHCVERTASGWRCVDCGRTFGEAWPSDDEGCLGPENVCDGYEWRGSVPWKCRLRLGHRGSCTGNQPIEGEPMTTRSNLPEGVTDTFTFTCQCEATVSVVGGVQQPHDCPLTEAERQAIRDAAAEAFDGS